MKKICSTPDCTEPFIARSLCNRHYLRAKTNGELALLPTFRRGVPARPLAERFWEKVNKDAPSGCWEWMGTKNDLGYGVFFVKKGHSGKRAHRIAFELVKGAIPAGLELDHLCRNPSCVDPTHLEPVTHRVNILRGAGHIPQQIYRTHCPKGHPYDEANTIRSGGHRYCKTCKRAADARLRRKKREAVSR